MFSYRSLLALFVVLSCILSLSGCLNGVQRSEKEALHGNSEATTIPFRVNGKDTGFMTEVVLGDYSESIKGDFGKDKEVHFEQIEEIIRVYFHPGKDYKSDPGHDNNIYWSYVGVMAPSWIYGGSSGYEPVSVKGKKVRFRGEFRFVDGGYWERRSLTYGATYAYYGRDRSDEKVVAFNYAGYRNASFEQAVLKGEGKLWWNDLNWGDWWDESYYPGTSEWIPFDFDVTAASGKALAESDSLEQDEVMLWGFWIGPEFDTGRSLTFDVRNLEAVIE